MFVYLMYNGTICTKHIVHVHAVHWYYLYQILRLHTFCIILLHVPSVVLPNLLCNEIICKNVKDRDLGAGTNEMKRALKLF